MKRYLFDNLQARRDFPHIGDRPEEFRRELAKFGKARLENMLHAEHYSWKREIVQEEIARIAAAEEEIAHRAVA